MKNQVQLIAYVDRFSGGDFAELNCLLKGLLAGVFGGAHLIPFFTPIDGADAGFDPIDHTQVDARLGTWEDVESLSRTVDLVADLIVNHVSSSSPQFLDFSRTGVGRDINRHYYNGSEIETALRRPLVQKQIELIWLRNTHPTFAGEFQVEAPTGNQINMKWSRQEHWIELHVDLSVPSASIRGTAIHSIAIPGPADPGAQF